MAKNENNSAIFVLILISAFIAFALFTLGAPSISGAAGSGSGQVTVTIGSLLSVVMQKSSVDFGTGYVTSPNAYALIDSNVSSVTGTNWTNSSNGANGWPASTDFLVIENNGNSNVAELEIELTEIDSDFWKG